MRAPARRRPRRSSPRAQVHHFSLHDLHARGYTRPVCMTYVTRHRDKLVTYFEELSERFCQVSRTLRHSNNLVFLHDVESRIKDLLLTRDVLVKEQAASKKPDTDEQNAHFDEFIHARIVSVAHVDELLTEMQALKKSLLDSMKDQLAEPVSIARWLAAFSRSVHGFSAFNFPGVEDALATIKESAADGSCKPPPVRPDHKAKPIRVLYKYNTHDKKLRPFKELCDVGFQEAWLQLVALYEKYRRPQMLLDLENADDGLLGASVAAIATPARIQPLARALLLAAHHRPDRPAKLQHGSAVHRKILLRFAAHARAAANTRPDAKAVPRNRQLRQLSQLSLLVAAHLAVRIAGVRLLSGTRAVPLMCALRLDSHMADIEDGLAPDDESRSSGMGTPSSTPGTPRDASVAGIPPSHSGGTTTRITVTPAADAAPAPSAHHEKRHPSLPEAPLSYVRSRYFESRQILTARWRRFPCQRARNVLERSALATARHARRPWCAKFPEQVHLRQASHLLVAQGTAVRHLRHTQQ